MPREARIQDNYKLTLDQIIVNYDENPRTSTNYGSLEEWDEFKNSIKNEGQQMPVVVSNAGDGKYNLTHGFRRLKAITELISEGEDIPFIRVMIKKANPEQILLNHITLNNGKPLTDYEISGIFIQLKKYGYSVKEIALKCGYSYQKTYNLINFQENASKKVKDAIETNEMSITAGLEISGSLDVESQNKLIETIKETETFKQSNKIKVKDVKQNYDLKEDALHVVMSALYDVFDIELEVDDSQDISDIQKFQARLVEYGYKICKK